VLGAVACALAALACGNPHPAAQAQAGPPPAMPAAFENGDVRLAFTLDFPGGRPPFPAVVLGHGSGRTTREQMRWMAREWNRMDFAALRFDKRGAGESTGEYSGVGPGNSERMFALLASDIAAGVRFLRTRPEIDSRRIGLSGISQAGWFIPLAASRLGDVEFLVLYSGPVCNVGLENYYSDFAEFTSRPLEEVYKLLPAFKGPIGFDPVPVLQDLKTPSLWLLGEEDRSIPVRTIVANLQALSSAGRPVEWRTYPGLGHSLSPAVWTDVERWVAKFK
jgi:uncharacterized protein